MRTTLNIDDDLLAAAMELSGIEERTALVREGLRALVQRESARRLALLGGSMPDLEAVPRRRPAKSPRSASGGTPPNDPEGRSEDAPKDERPTDEKDG